MAEPNSNIDRSMQALDNYPTSWTVLARFMLYDFTEEPMDTVREAYAGSRIEASSNILDVGASDGSDLERIAFEFRHHGLLVGVDINWQQYARKNWPDIPDSIMDTAIRAALVDHAVSIHGDSTLLRGNPPLLVAGKGAALPFTDNSFDHVLMDYYLYHEKNQEAAMQEGHRVLVPMGKLSAATSDIDNKPRHRELEAMAAEEMGVEPPLKMNDSCTFDRLKELLSTYFKQVYCLEQHAPMHIRTSFEVEAYIASQFSMYNQYDGIPDREVFIESMNNLRRIINQEIDKKGAFTDFISRIVCISTDDAAFVPAWKQERYYKL